MPVESDVKDTSRFVLAMNEHKSSKPTRDAWASLIDNVLRKNFHYKYYKLLISSPPLVEKEIKIISEAAALIVIFNQPLERQIVEIRR